MKVLSPERSISQQSPPALEPIGLCQLRSQRQPGEAAPRPGCQGGQATPSNAPPQPPPQPDLCLPPLLTLTSLLLASAYKSEPPAAASQ